jgi:formylglycine-generating enzyme required for sulfatase activity
VKIHGLAAGLTFTALLSRPAAAQSPSLQTTLERAGRYVMQFVGEFSNVVAEEAYAQDSLGNLPIVMPGRGGVVAAPPSRHRDLKSDFLLVRIGPTDWLPFRDVFEVDGQKVRDREGRLAKLFLQSKATALEQATQITLESARYNLGAMQRTINTPILSLVFLQPEMQRAFQYTLGKRDPTAGEEVWIVEFKEVGRPTFVRGLRDSNVPAIGRYWIDVETGRIVRTELQLETPGIRARLTTSFRRDERFGIDVPFEMREQYQLDRGQVSATATYGHFRRFDVISDETFHDPTAAVPPVLVTDRKTGMTLLEITPGRFSMGSPTSELGRRDDEAQHDVTIDRPFFIGKNEVTQQEWRTVMGSNPSRFADCGPRCPVENVTFAEVEQFVAALNTQADAQLIFRLPTEAEWEYACRAGTITPFSTGEMLTTAQANYNGRQPYAKTPAGMFRERPTRAAGFPPNAWGVADMHGNVAEWVADWYGPYPTEDVINPGGAGSGDQRIVRGGSWQSDGVATRCAARITRDPTSRDGSVGFRVAAERVRH